LRALHNVQVPIAHQVKRGHQRLERERSIKIAALKQILGARVSTQE
jgi:hypothetical protein